MKAPFNRTLRIEEGCLIVPLELIEGKSYKASFDVAPAGTAELRFLTTPAKHELIRKELLERCRRPKEPAIETPSSIAERPDTDDAATREAMRDRMLSMIRACTDKELCDLHRGQHEKIGPLIVADVRREMERRGLRLDGWA